MKSALVDVIGRMSRLPPLPRDVDRPVVQLGGNDSNQNLSYFFVQLLPGTQGSIDDYRRFVEDVVKSRIESVPGVALVEIQGGPPNDVRITSISRAPRRSASAFRISRARPRAPRTSPPGSSTSVAANTLFAIRVATRRRISASSCSRGATDNLCGSAIVATVELRPPERRFISYQNGNPAIGLRVERAPGANVLSTLEEVKRVVAELRDGPLKERGLGIEQSFDASLFITRAVNLLIENLVVGALLALVCVWWFMRDTRATVVIATTIPVCLLATFCALELAGRSINVISLAGLAFAVGMVVEGAIVVSGNIIRLKEGGMPIAQAAHDGARQVVPALFASTTTTIAVFLPVLFLKDVEGQIFADLALTISIAVAFSIVVAVTVVPAAAGRWLGAHSKNSGYGAGWPGLTDRVIEWTRTRKQQWMWVGALLVAPLATRLAVAAEARLPAAGEARGDRRILQFPAGHEPRSRQSRDRRQAASNACSLT